MFADLYAGSAHLAVVTENYLGGRMFRDAAFGFATSHLLQSRVNRKSEGLQTDPDTDKDE
jgi:hypothetical protein